MVCVERVIVERVVTAAVLSHMVIAAFTEAAALVAFKVSAAEADYGSFSSFAFRHGVFHSGRDRKGVSADNNAAAW